ncbi:MAG: peptidoglycan-binding domain-containing protein, partial [Paracoccaceae bacterium]|nr:peptidoglycan-binding domain-containing protein [Paracoccaceae bacterium]
MAVLAEPNSSSEIVLEAQKLLNKTARQSRAPENGAFDKNTSAAIKQFQIESGLKPTGVLDSKLMDILRKAATLPPPKYQITIGSKIYLFTQSEYDKLIDKIKGDFKEPMRQMKMAAEDARFYWKFHDELRNDQYIVGWCIEAWG